MNKITKIIELLIDFDNEEVEDVGVDIMSLVDTPAIGVSWQAFAKQVFDEAEDIEMVDGIIDLLNKVEDLENRKKMAQDVVEDFERNSIDYDKESFLERIGLTPSEEEFETYNDYPESAKNNAQRAIDWAEENGWGSCGTDVGKQRAHQLAKGENISEDTIARMSSFARHKKNSETPYSEGCGKLMWDAWGGTSGIEWAQNKLKKIREEKLESDAISLIESETFGETIDMEKTVFVDFTQEKFNTVTDVIQGILGLGVATRPTSTSETKYMYAGPSSSRPFCSALLRLNKAYTEEELRQMGGSVGNGIGDTGSTAVSVWHGGPNCRHWFNNVTITRESTGKTMITNNGPDSRFGTPMADRNLQGYKSQASKDKAMKWWWANNNFNSVEMKFQTDDEKMIITGPAMKAFQMIPRRDDDGNLYHVYFSDETIKKISQKFLRDNAHATDINHSMEATEENTLLESWIVEDPEMDKSKALGFNPSKGDWYVSYKINNEETWNKIKNGELNGYSIAGQFIEKVV